MAEKTATETVADDDLSAAWDNAAEAPEAEKPEEAAPQEEAVAEAEEPEEEEELDHKSKSKLGRNIKGLRSQMDAIMARLDQMQAPAKAEPAHVETEEMPETISTPADIDKYLSAKEKRLQQEKLSYESGYLKQVQGLSKANEDMHEEIFAEMMQNFNVRHSNDASVDARINYAEAKAAVLNNKLSEKAGGLPKRATAGKPPVQPAASATHAATRVATIPKLDEHAADYVKYLKKKGMSDEQIAEEMGE
jgi:hypothetical protein